MALDADGIPSAGIEMEIVNSCESGNGGCSHLCHHSSTGPICTCNSGYRLQDDHRTCTGKARLAPCFHKSIPSHEDPHVSAAVCTYTMRLSWSNVNNCCYRCVLTPSTFCFYLDINECEDGSHCCQQDCYNYPGGYECACHAGYRLRADGCACDGEQGACSAVCVLSLLL